MELWAFQQITEGMDSLAQLEEVNPVLGKKLKDFVDRVSRCCVVAYERFSSSLDSVLTLPLHPDESQRSAVLGVLRAASDSSWFRDVARICDELAAVANTYDADLRRQAENQREGDGRYSIRMLLEILHMHEGSLKDDIRSVVDTLKTEIATDRIEDARQRALRIKGEIASYVTRITGTATRIAGSSRDGAQAVLSKEEVAETALRRPERILVFNAGMVVLLLIVGATVLRFVSIFAFPVLTAFVITVIIVLNALYLRSIDKLSEENFIELMRLALLKFFAPLSRPATQQGSEGEGKG